MTFSVWDRVAALIEPPLVLLLEATAPLRAKERDDLNSDSYYEPPGYSEREEVMHCDDCDGETIHAVVKWQDTGDWTRECEDCGRADEIEPDE